MRKRIIQLGPCPKGYTHDQDKACSPEETVARFKARLDAAGLDVLREVRRIDNGRLDIPVYFSVCGKDAREIIGTKKQMGKGATPIQSQASACMELAERFSFFSFLRDPDNFLIGDYDDMRSQGYPVLDPQVLLDSVGDTSHDPAFLGRLLAGLPLRWTWAYNLTGNEEVLVPFSWFYAINEFNGPSAGNTHEEAILQGISEVVERHVCALVNRGRLDTPAIDLDSVTDPVAVELIEKFQRAGITLHVNDFSLDTGIPTVAALAYDQATFPKTSEIVFTAGTTPGAAKALIRALTEVAQLAGDFNTSANYVASGLPKPRSLDEVDYVINSSGSIALAEMADLHDADFFVELQNCVQALARINMEVLVIDTTHPELDIPAAYTIIPGAQFRERAASGDAPLFAAKLVTELLHGRERFLRLAALEELLPDAYYLQFYLGRHLYDEGDPEQARTYLEKALTKQPRDEDLPYIHSYLGSCLRDLGRFEEAIACLKTGLQHDPNRPDLYNILGVCAFKTEQFEDAVRYFQEAVRLNPASGIDHANLALNQEKTGNIEEAVINYQIALSIDPDIEFARAGLKRLAARLN